MGRDFALTVCRLTKRSLFFMSRIPSFSADYLRRNPAFGRLPALEAGELHEFWSNCASSNRGQAAAVVLIYLTYCFKNAFIPIKSLELFNYESPESNFRDDTSHYEMTGEHLISFSCLATNCSQLRRGHDERPASLALLAEDASKLPFFVLCHPRLDRIYTPVTKLDALGMLSFSMSSFHVLLLGAWIPLSQFFWPAHDLMIMFIVAPGPTRQLMRARARDLVLDLAVSLHNFRLDWNNNHTRSQPTSPLYSPSERLLYSGACPSASEADWPPSPSASRRSELETLGLGLAAPSQQRPFSSNWRPDSASSSIPHIAIDEGAQQQRLQSDQLMETIARCSSLRGKTNQQLEQLVDEIMPSVRSNWWRAHQARAFCWIMLFSMSSIIILGSSAFAYIQVSIWKKQQLLAQFADSMRHQNCALWTKIDASNQRQCIQLNQIDLNWSLWSIIETLGLNFLPGFSTAVMLAYYLCFISEISVWLAEARLSLIASLVASRFKLATKAPSACRPKFHIRPPPPGSFECQRSDSIAFESSQSTFRIAVLREKFISESRFKLGFPLSVVNPATARCSGSSSKPRYDFINSKKIDKIRLQHLVNQYEKEACHAPNRWTQDRPDDERRKLLVNDNYLNDVETLEQIYVNFRLFVEHAQKCAPCVGVLLSVTYPLNYGLVCIGVFYSRNVAGFTNGPLFVIICGWFTSNFLILLSANFHANAKSLQPLLWSIIAQLTYSSEIRARHLRSLWLKQAQILNSQGDLALTAFKIRITYVNIIQLMIWTTTIFAIALKQH